MTDFRSAYQEFQHNLIKLKGSLQWLCIGFILTIGILILSLIFIVK